MSLNVYNFKLRAKRLYLNSKSADSAAFHTKFHLQLKQRHLVYVTYVTYGWSLCTKNSSSMTLYYVCSSVGDLNGHFKILNLQIGHKWILNQQIQLFFTPNVAFSQSEDILLYQHMDGHCISNGYNLIGELKGHKWILNLQIRQFFTPKCLFTKRYVCQIAKLLPNNHSTKLYRFKIYSSPIALLPKFCHFQNVVLPNRPIVAHSLADQLSFYQIMSFLSVPICKIVEVSKCIFAQLLPKLNWFQTVFLSNCCQNCIVFKMYFCPIAQLLPKLSYFEVDVDGRGVIVVHDVDELLLFGFLARNLAAQIFDRPPQAINKLIVFSEIERDKGF